MESWLDGEEVAARLADVLLAHQESLGVPIDPTAMDRLLNNPLNDRVQLRQAEVDFSDPENPRLKDPYKDDDDDDDADDEKIDDDDDDKDDDDGDFGAASTVDCGYDAKAVEGVGVDYDAKTVEDYEAVSTTVVDYDAKEAEEAEEIETFAKEMGTFAYELEEVLKETEEVLKETELELLKDAKQNEVELEAKKEAKRRRRDEEPCTQGGHDEWLSILNM